SSPVVEQRQASDQTGHPNNAPEVGESHSPAALRLRENCPPREVNQARDKDVEKRPGRPVIAQHSIGSAASCPVSAHQAGSASSVPLYKPTVCHCPTAGVPRSRITPDQPCYSCAHRAARGTADQWPPCRSG